jgi:hypothetical protein
VGGDLSAGYAGKLTRFYFYLFTLFYLFIFAVLELELRAYTLSQSTSPFL